MNHGWVGTWKHLLISLGCLNVWVGMCVVYRRPGRCGVGRQSGEETRTRADRAQYSAPGSAAGYGGSHLHTAGFASGLAENSIKGM